MYPCNVLYLVRHGESMGNVTRRLLSASDDVLTDTGKAQALRLGEHFAEEGIQWTRAYSSDYARARDTALGILSKLSDQEASASLAIVQDKRLRERHYGDFEGLSYREAFQKYHEQKSDSGGDKHSSGSLMSIMEFEMPGGESVVACVERMKDFFRELFDDLDSYSDGGGTASQGQGASVLVVSHSFAMVAFMNALSLEQEHSEDGAEFQLLNWNGAEDLKMMRNVSYMKIGIGDKKRQDSKGKWTRTLDFLAKHQTKHLDGLSTDGTFSNFAKETREASQFVGCVQQ